MSSKEQSQWDAVRFLTTLNYFGEVPFIGNFRWLQQLFGRQTSQPGRDINVMNPKVVIVSSQKPVWLSQLQTQLPATVETVALSASDSDTGAPHHLDNGPEQGTEAALLARLKAIYPRSMHPHAAVTVVIDRSLSDCPATSNLVASIVSYLGETSDVLYQPIFDFTDPSVDLTAWGALDDVVMGGVSQGQFLIGESPSGRQAVFAGTVSTENSGGFSSVRTQNFEPPFDFSGWAGIQLRVRGDGQRYKFILRNSNGWDSPAYIYGFDTVAGTWVTVNVPFADMVPTFRARSVPSAAPLDPSCVFSIQLMLSKFEVDRQLNPHFKPGPFELAVGEMSVYRQRPSVPLVVLAHPDEAIRGRQQSILAEAQLPYRLIEPGQADIVRSLVDALTQ